MNTFKVMTYNVDGLPLFIDLSTLPWFLKPIYYIFKLLKKETVITVNPDGKGSTNAKQIAQIIKDNKYDLIGLNEDFNYHNDYVETLSSDYKFGTYKTGLDFKKFFKMIHLHWKRYPSWKSDGLMLLAKDSRINIISEDIITWNDSYGYVDHCNDSLMDKGFRHYVLKVDDVLMLNVYILHMDADCWDDTIALDLEARTNQFKLLSDYIKNHNNYPSIIMGDFNSTYSREFDKNNIETYLLNNFNHIYDAYLYCGKEEREEIDKIFFINTEESEYVIEALRCSVNINVFKDSDKRQLSDHYPVIAEFSYRKK